MLITLLAYQLVWLWWRLNRRRVNKWWLRVKDHHPRQQHPQSPKDCPPCCRGVQLETAWFNWDVTPWREVKSRRGRKKKNAKPGYACLNPACPQYAHAEETIHDLVHPAADTHRGVICGAGRINPGKLDKANRENPSI